jgi:hypothetical protein
MSEKNDNSKNGGTVPRLMIGPDGKIHDENEGCAVWRCRPIEAAPVSSCCRAPVAVSSDNEGTNCYICGRCTQPCDAVEDAPVCEHGITEGRGCVCCHPAPVPTKVWLDPTPEMLSSPEFNAVWNCIKSWDIGVPSVYQGYCGATGNHVRAILDALKPAPVPPPASPHPMDGYRLLEKGEVIEADDETDACRDAWRDDARWVKVPPHMVGKQASDPQYVSHSIYRRRVPPPASPDQRTPRIQLDTVRLHADIAAVERLIGEHAHLADQLAAERTRAEKAEDVALQKIYWLNTIMEALGLVREGDGVTHISVPLKEIESLKRWKDAQLATAKQRDTLKADNARLREAATNLLHKLNGGDSDADRWNIGMAKAEMRATLAATGQSAADATTKGGAR